VPDQRDLRPDDMPDASLDAALADLGGTLAWPRPRPDFAVLVRTRIQATPAAGEPAWRRWQRWASAPGGVRPVRRSLLIAVALLLVAATVAAAMWFGLPGIRLIFGPPPIPTQSATVRPSGALPSLAPGATLGLGQLVDVAEISTRSTFPIRFPTDPLAGPPDTAWIDPSKADQVSLVWSPRPDLPATLDGSVGLLLGQFNGRLNDGFITKAIDSGTTVERVRVGDSAGFWISGAPHFFYYEDANGEFIEDSRRWVGDTLLWTDGTTTYRLEAELGREAAIRIAESLR
jgi:hypothetical protein